MNAGAWAAFVALGIVWGLPYFLIKIALVELSPLVVAFGRLLLGAAVLLPLAARRGVIGPTLARWRPVLAFALAEYVVPFCSISIGEQWISSSVTGMLIAMVPLSMAVISRFFGVHEPFGPVRIAGLLLGLGGVALLLGFGTVTGAHGWLGVGCMIAATAGYAIGPLIVQRYLQSVDAMACVAVSTAMASALLLGPALATWPSQWPSWRPLAAVAVLGLVCTAVAMRLMFFLISQAGANRTSVIAYVNPAVATLLGVWILKEPLGWSGYVAFALILLGSWLSTRAPASAASQA